jgi:arsenate reductase
VKWLRGHGISFTEVPIRETPPGRDEVKAALKASGGRVAALLNTSGQDYRRLGLKERIADMPEEELLGLLTSNGNLVKRPFVADSSRGVYLTGFSEERWAESLGD